MTYKISNDSGHLTAGYKDKLTEGLDSLQWSDWHKDVKEMIEKTVNFIREMNR